MISHDLTWYKQSNDTVPSTIRVTLYIAVNIKGVYYNDMAFFRPKVEIKFQRKSK